MRRLRILMVEDHAVIKTAIREVLSGKGPLQPQIVGEASDGATAIELARGLRPDLVTLGIGLSDVNGFEVARRLRAETPDTRVIIVTVHDEDLYREAAAETGAVGYVIKDRIYPDLLPAIEKAVRGGVA